MIGRDGAKQDARRLTEEIEAATNAALPGDAAGESAVGDTATGNAMIEGDTAAGNAMVEENTATGNVAGGAASGNLAANGADLGRGIISTMDAQVLEQTPGRGQEWREQEQRVQGQQEREQVEIVTGMAERDNGYGNEYEPGITTVGETSNYEAGLRREQEAQNLWNDNNPKGDRDAKIVAKSQEEHGRAANQKVREEYAKGDFEISAFMKWFRSEQDQALLDLENPHSIGSGN